MVMEGIQPDLVFIDQHGLKEAIAIAKGPAGGGEKGRSCGQEAPIVIDPAGSRIH